MNRTLLILLIFYHLIFSSCLQKSLDESTLELNDWEVNIGNGWQKTKPVPWETDSELGGLAAKNYDGYAEYRTFFTLTPSMKKESLAFFAHSIDDADEAYLNGHFIGRTGKIPKSHSLYPIGFRSATREARVYLLPKEYYSSSGNDELKLKVYDYAGLGGFSFAQTPMLANFSNLILKEKLIRWGNDIPRTFALSFLLVMVFIFSSRFLHGAKPNTIQKILIVALSPLFIWKYFFTSTGVEVIPIKLKILARLLLVSIFCMMAAVFLVNETTYKYLLIEDEAFFFKIPTICFVIGMICLLMIFHPDVFGDRLLPSMNRFLFSIRALLSFLSHPILAVFFLFYLIYLPPNQVWNLFTIAGVGYCFFTLTILFAMTSISLIRVSFSRNKIQKRSEIRKEGFKRCFVLVGMLGANAIWFFNPILMNNSFLIVVFFSVVYLSLSISFISRNRIPLPIQLPASISVPEILQQDFHFTITETKIAMGISQGISRSKLLKDLNITPNTLKKHLHSIYGKVEAKRSETIGHSRDKFQRLTVFLNSISSK